MPLILLFVLYQLVSVIALPLVIIIIFMIRLKGKVVVGNFLHRIGIVPMSEHLSSTTNVIWIHACSVGEVLSMEHVIATMRKKYPDALFYLTTNTPHGKAVAEKHLSVDSISYVPFDFLACIMIFFLRVKPTKIYLVEAEIWPNLIMYAHFSGIECSLINARITKKEFSKYQRLILLYKPLLSTLKNIMVQSSQDREYFIQLGQDPKKIIILGNIKAYNVAQKHKHMIKALSYRKRASKTITLLVGSVHSNEIDTYLKLFIFLRESGHNIRLILVPRYLHEQELCESMIKQYNLAYSVWDNMPMILNSETLRNNESTIMLICALGVLFALYTRADIFFLGGTFVPLGGHNLLEPAVWGIVSVVGPYHENSLITVQALAAKNALAHAPNQKALNEVTHELIKNPDKRIQMGHNASQWLASQAAAVKKKLWVVV